MCVDSYIEISERERARERLYYMYIHVCVQVALQTERDTVRVHVCIGNSSQGTTVGL